MLRQVEESAAARAAVAVLCTYEAAAILTGIVPTITALHRRQPLVGAVILGALGWHFRPPA